MIGAIEFLRKAKAICKSMKDCEGCPIERECGDENPGGMDELVFLNKVMDYEIKESQEVNPCSTCEENQLVNCAYLENDDRKSCAKITKHESKEEY